MSILNPNSTLDLSQLNPNSTPDLSQLNPNSTPDLSQLNPNEDYDEILRLICKPIDKSRVISERVLHIDHVYELLEASAHHAKEQKHGANEDLQVVSTI